MQNIQIRKVFQEAGVNCQPGQETEQAPALLRTLGELAAWLKETERRIRDKLADGPVVV